VIFAALALIGCRDLGVSYHVGVSSGVSSFDRPVSDFNSQAVYVGVSFSPYMARAQRLEADWEVARANREARIEKLAAESAERERHMEALAEADLLLHKPGADFDSVWAEVQDDAPEAEADIELSDFTEKPETMDDAVIYLLWIVGLCVLLLTLKYVGLLNRFLPDKKKPKPEDSD
jgi:hypothetical protein